MRTRRGSLGEDDALLAFEKVRAREGYRPGRAYHLIFYFLSEDVRAQMKPRRARTALL